MSRPELWLRAPDDEQAVISSAVLKRDQEHDLVRFYARGELAGELRLRLGDGAAVLLRLGMQLQD